MRLVDPPTGPSDAGQLMTRWHYLRCQIKNGCIRLRRKLPYLVWCGQEIDVRVTFTADTLDPDDPFKSFYGGALREAQRCLSAAGVDFDAGQGTHGRDWEWDFSLRGPISVRFRNPAERPERRCQRPRPRLVPSDAQES